MGIRLIKKTNFVNKNMSDLPENLQIKLESPNIKERLNLHVKRRLQHDPDPTPPTMPDNKRAKSKEKDKEKEPKPRKPYQKRVDKIKTEAAVAATSATVGKGKKGASQIASPAADLEPMMDDADQDLGAGGTGGGSPEAAGRSNASRDRHKNADILNMVLSVKKRALLQDPEVQKFWSNIMHALGK